MKIKIAVLVVCMMMFMGLGSAFADELGTTPTDTVNKTTKWSVLKEFQDEIHGINSLKIEEHGLKIQVIQKHDQILDLVLLAKENGNKEALQAASELKKQIRLVQGDLNTLQTEHHNEMKAFRQAVKDRNQEQAQTHIDNAAGIYESMNSKLGEKINLLENVIAVLSE